jgi:hypothetical protein
MSSFKDDFLAGKVMFDDIEEYITHWHNNPSELTLPEYLGLSEQEYQDYVTNLSKFRKDLYRQF